MPVPAQPVCHEGRPSLLPDRLTSGCGKAARTTVVVAGAAGVVRVRAARPWPDRSAPVNRSGAAGPRVGRADTGVGIAARDRSFGNDRLDFRVKGSHRNIVMDFLNPMSCAPG